MTESSQQMNRRAFLGKSAAALAAGAVLPRTALSYENIVGANDRISLGLIGCGTQGRYNLQQLMKLDGVRAAGILRVAFLADQRRLPTQSHP